MKRIVGIAIVSAVLLLGAAASGYAWSGGHGGGSHGGGSHGSSFSARIVIGPGFWWGPPAWYGYPYRPYPYYAYASPVVIQSTPPVYVQRGQEATAQYWYYCEEARTYYPYVRECPAGWMTIVPQTPSR